MSRIEIGSAVISKAGRDKGKYMVVIGIEENYAIIADGQLRKLSNPKKKKFIHLQSTNVVFGAEDMDSDSKIRKALKQRFAEA